MLAHLSLQVWSARKCDRKISHDVAQAHGADGKIGRYNKRLLPGEAPSYDEIGTCVGKARDFHYKNTLPWSQEGARILPVSNYMEYNAAMRTFREEFELAVTKFVIDYPTLRENARKVLNGMYRDADYPDLKRLKKKFGFHLGFFPLPNEKDFRVQLNETEVANIRSQIAAEVETANTKAMRDLWNRLYESVTHIVGRLSDPEAKFRDSLITNARELCILLPRLNMAGDEKLERMRQEVERTLLCHLPGQLREDKALRATVAQRAQSIQSVMAAYMGEVHDDGD